MHIHPSYCHRRSLNQAFSTTVSVLHACLRPFYAAGLRKLPQPGAKYLYCYVPVCSAQSYSVTMFFRHPAVVPYSFCFSPELWHFWVCWQPLLTQIQLIRISLPCSQYPFPDSTLILLLEFCYLYIPMYVPPISLAFVARRVCLSPILQHAILSIIHNILQPYNHFTLQ